MLVAPFKLHIKIKKAGPHSFRATITAPDGEETITFPFPLSEKELDATLSEFRRNIKNIRGELDDPASLAPNALTPKALGIKLFDTLFKDKAKTLYDHNRTQSQRNRRPLQCVLDIAPNLTPLINLPWEYLHDEGRRVRGGFFAFNSLTPILRRWQGEEPAPFETDPPLRVLLISAQPKGDEAGLGNLSREVKIIKKRLEVLNRSGEIKARIDHLEAATLTELKAIIRDLEKTPHIIHFIGHGNVGELLFEDRDGKRAPITEETLLNTLQNAPSLRLVLLNACRTAAAPDALQGQLGVAQSLADAGIPAVIAMQFNISDDAAATFSDEFYKVLAEGKPVEEAVTWGRIAIKDKLAAGAEWGTPVFYLQIEDGDVFKDLLQKEKTDVSSPTSSVPPYKPPSSVSAAQVKTLITVSKTERKRRQEEEIAQQIDPLKKRLQIHDNNLHHLKKQKAQHGIDTPLHIFNGIKNEEEEIEKIQMELSALIDDSDSYKPEDGVSSETSPHAHKTQEMPPSSPNVDTRTIKKIAPSIRYQVTQMFEEGVSAFQKEEWSEAVKRLSNAQKLAPDLPDIEEKVKQARQNWQATAHGERTYLELDARYKLGKEYLNNQSWKDAASLLEGVTVVDAGYKDVYNLALQTRQEADAEKAAAEKQKKLKELYTNALTYEGNKAWEKAVETWTEIVELDENYKDARNRLNEATRQYNMATAYDEGERAYKKKDWATAVVAFSKVRPQVGEYPDTAKFLKESRRQRSLDIRVKEAEDYLKLENWDEVIKTLQGSDAVKERREGELALNYALARRHYDAGEWKQSAERFEAIIGTSVEYRPDVESKYQEAVRRARLERLSQQAVSAIGNDSWSEAKTSLEQIKKEDEAYPGLAEKLEQVDKELSLQKLRNQAQKERNARQWAAAIPLLEKILEERPHGYENAAGWLKEAKKQVKLNAIYNRGIEAMGELDWQTARDAFEGVEKIDPNFRKTEQYLQNARDKIELTDSFKQGSLIFQQGGEEHNLSKLAEAIVFLDKAAKIDPDFQGVENKYHQAKRAHKLLELYLDGQTAFDEAAANRNEGDWEQAIIHWTKLVVDEGEANYHIDQSGSAAQKLKEAERQKDLRNLYQDAKKAMAQKEWAQAIALLKKLTVDEAEPDYPHAAEDLKESELQLDLLTVFNQAEEAMKREEWQNAISHFTYIQNSVRPNYRRQEVAEQLKQAERYLELETNYNQGMTAIKAKTWGEAVKCFDRIWDMDKEYRDVETRRKQAKTEQTLQKLYQEGETALQEREWTTAIEKFSKIQEENPNYKEAKQKLAEAHKQQRLEKEHQRALEHLNGHRWKEAIPILESILAEQTDYRNAAEQLEQAKEEIWLIETHRQAKEKIGQGAWAEAIDLLTQINQKRADYKDTAVLLESASKENTLSQLYTKAKVKSGPGNKDQWGEALALFEKILILDPNYKNAHSDLDAASEKAGLKEKIQQAKQAKDFHNAEGILETDDESRWNEGVARLKGLLAEAPDYKPAKELLEKTRQRKVTRFADLRQAADSAKANKNWPEAIAALTRLTVMEPDDANLKQELKQAYAAQEQQKQRKIKYLLIATAVIILLLSCIFCGIFTKGFGIFAGGDATPTPTELAGVTPMLPTTSTPEIVTSATLTPTETPQQSTPLPTDTSTSATPVEETPSVAPPPADTLTSEPPTETPTGATTESSTPLPDPVTNLQVVNPTQTGVTLNWTNPADNYAQVLLQGGGTNIELSADAQSYTISNLQCETSYNFTLLTINQTGQSEPISILAQTADCPPPPLSLTGKIAAPVYQNGMYNIYLAKAAEADEDWQPEILFDRASQPAFTKDGKGVIFRSWNAPDWAVNMIYMPDYTNIASFRKMGILIDDAHPILNETKTDIVFHSRPNNGPSLIMRLGTFDGAENDKNNQINLGFGQNPDWLGEQIIFYSKNPTSGLYIMDQDSGNRRMLLQTAQSVIPAAAPDGDLIAVSLKTNGKWQVFTLSASQGEESLTRLTTSDTDHYLPAWSPDGQSIAFITNRDDKLAVWVMNADGTNQRELFDLPGATSIDGPPEVTDINQNTWFGWWDERLSWVP